MDCLPSQLPPGKRLMDFLCSLPWFLSPYMLSLSLVSQFSLDPSPCRGLQVPLFRRGGLLLRSGGLPLRLFQSGGLQLRRGGLLPGLLCTGGLQSRPLRPGGLQSRPLRHGGPLLRPGGLLSRLLRPGGLLSRLLCPGGLLSCLLRPGWLLFRRLHPGPLLGWFHSGLLLRLGALACRLCLSPQSLHFHMDLALYPSPCSASAPPPSWIV